MSEEQKHTRRLVSANYLTAAELYDQEQALNRIGALEETNKALLEACEECLRRFAKSQRYGLDEGLPLLRDAIAKAKEGGEK